MYEGVLGVELKMLVQPGGVKLVLCSHWMHLSCMHPVTSENQFHCTRLLLGPRPYLSFVFVRLSSSTSRVSITRIIVTLRMVEMVIWFFLSTGASLGMKNARLRSKRQGKP